MGVIGHQQARAAEVARNYRKRERSSWYSGISKDLIDTKALTDSTLTRSENAKNLRDLWRNYR